MFRFPSVIVILTVVINLVSSASGCISITPDCQCSEPDNKGCPFYHLSSKLHKNTFCKLPHVIGAGTEFYVKSGKNGEKLLYSIDVLDIDKNIRITYQSKNLPSPNTLDKWFEISFKKEKEFLYIYIDNERRYIQATPYNTIEFYIKSDFYYTRNAMCNPGDEPFTKDGPQHTENHDSQNEAKPDNTFFGSREPNQSSTNKSTTPISTSVDATNNLNATTTSKTPAFINMTTPNYITRTTIPISTDVDTTNNFNTKTTSKPPAFMTTPNYSNQTQDGFMTELLKNWWFWLLIAIIIVILIIVITLVLKNRSKKRVAQKIRLQEGQSNLGNTDTGERWNNTPRIVNFYEQSGSNNYDEHPIYEDVYDESQNEGGIWKRSSSHDSVNSLYGCAIERNS